LILGFRNFSVRYWGNEQDMQVTMKDIMQVKQDLEDCMDIMKEQKLTRVLKELEHKLLRQMESLERF
jgi:chorismate mutase